MSLSRVGAIQSPPLLHNLRTIDRPVRQCPRRCELHGKAQKRRGSGAQVPRAARPRQMMRGLPADERNRPDNDARPMDRARPEPLSSASKPPLFCLAVSFLFFPSSNEGTLRMCSVVR
ncbi:hypothetical protein BS78_06G120800 [Paspalum vaginatum]|nr:hypothetical protein BS78_06G120800 [Paspalum vaginatum]